VKHGIGAQEDGAMEREQELSSLKRALKALTLINQLGSVTIAQLAQRMALARSTAERVLLTLHKEGYLDRDAETKAFFLTAQVHALSDGYAEESRLVEVARPLLFESTRRIGWPLLLVLPMGEYTSVRVTSDCETTLGLNRRHIGSALPMGMSAGGLTYLAFLDEVQRNFMTEMLKSSTGKDQAIVHDPSRYAYILDKIRTDGFGFGLDHGRERGVAVPVIIGGRVRASLVMAYMARVLSMPKIVQDYVPTLKRLALQIAADAEHASRVASPRSARSCHEAVALEPQLQ
jgi:IclR family transcriptional regulator, mhp operon transcriptional activator